jgi:mRNA interferase MazF
MKRGQVVLVDLEPVQGHEQGRTQPCVVLSVEAFHTCGAGLVMVAPLTTRIKALPDRVTIDPTPFNQLPSQSQALPTQLRTISLDRIKRSFGVIEDQHLEALASHLIKILGLT